MPGSVSVRWFCEVGRGPCIDTTGRDETRRVGKTLSNCYEIIASCTATSQQLVTWLRCLTFIWLSSGSTSEPAIIYKHITSHLHISLLVCTMSYLPRACVLSSCISYRAVLENMSPQAVSAVRSSEHVTYR